MQKMSFRNKEKAQSTLQSLAQALGSRDKSVINTGTVAMASRGGGSDDNVADGASSLLTNGFKLGKTLFDNYKDSGTSSDIGIFGKATNDYMSGKPDYGIFGNAANDSIMGTAGSGSAVGDAVGAEVGSGTGGGVGSGLPWGMIANAGKGIYNKISGHTPEEYSDLEQSTIYPLQGAANGFSIGGPWGALGGALYGLGYSFKDDLGLKDSNFLTQLLFPIGMGDGGGLRISGEPILDIL